MDLSVMKEYLVLLRPQADKKELAEFKKALDKVEKDVTGAAERTGKLLGLVAAAISGAYVTFAGSLLLLGDKVAQADLSYQIFATRMMTSLDVARKMKIATDALGYSLEDIVWNKELHNRFDQLLKDQTRLTAALGPDYEANMKRIRDIRFEFTRLRVASDYLAMAFINTLFKAFGTDAERFLKRLEGITEWAIRELPMLADKLSTTLKPILSDMAIVGGDFWNSMKGATSEILHLIGVMSGDKELEKGALTLENFARAARHASTDIGTLAELTLYAVDGMIYLAKAIPALSNQDWASLAIANEQYRQDARAHNRSIQRLSANDPEDIRDVLQRPEAQGSAMRGPLAHFIRPLSMHTEAANSLASQARELAKAVSGKTGVPANLIWEQWANETNGFRSGVMAKANNLGGIGGADSLKQYGSLAEFGDAYSRLLLGRHKGALGATTAEEFATALRSSGYYNDVTAQQYAGRMNQFSGQWAAGDTTINVQVGGVHIHGNADRQQVEFGVLDALEKKFGKSDARVTRNMLQLASPFGN